MNRKLAKTLLRLYPQGWRERYATEFEALLEESPGGLATVLNVVGSALGERVLPTTGGDMTSESSRIERLSLQAPWAVFGIAPMVLFAAAYGFALFILWSGWQIFLPDEKMPFVPVDGWAIAYFSVGRILYFCTPMTLGLAIAWMAARPGVKVIWPSVGLVLIALLACAAEVRVSRASMEVPGQVGLQWAFGHAGYTATLLVVSILFYLLLRVRRRDVRQRPS